MKKLFELFVGVQMGIDYLVWALISNFVFGLKEKMSFNVLP